MTYNKNRLEFDKNDGLYLKDETDFYPGCVIVPNGQTLGERFIIKELLHSENHSTTYFAEDTLKKIDVVIKTADIGSHQEKTPGALLKLETDTYKILSSPNIMRVYNLHHADIGGTALLILSMEYFGGKTFRQWLSDCFDNNLRREKGLEWFKNICQGIGSAHNAKIIHLNINSENIFIKDEQLKISGFETSNFARIKIVNKGLSMESILKKANPAYMSPELFNTPHPDELTPAADIYSLGILLYELVHPRCCTPFTGSYSALRDFHINVLFKKIETIDSKLSDIIARCLEKNPSKRYQTAWELLDELEKKPSQKTQKIEAFGRLNQEKADVKFQEILRYYDEKKFNKVTRLIDEILIQTPDHINALQLQSWLAKKYHQAEQLYEEIKQGLESEEKSLKLLLGLLKHAMNIFPDHPSGVIIQHKVLNLSQLFRTSMEKGSEALQAQNWQEALQFFEQVHKIEAGSGVLKIKIEQLQKIKSMKCEIDENIKNGDLEKARRLAHLTDLSIKEIRHSNT